MWLTLLVKAALYVAASKRGRRLAQRGARGAWRLAESKRARAAYSRAWKLASDPRPRRGARRAVSSLVGRRRRR